jgi:prepilin-type N-terminal cleavage/methylation domain-containing protein
VERERVNATRRRSESGFTLIELLIAVVILSLLTGAISAAFVTAMNDTQQTGGRVEASNDAQVIAAFLIRDAQAAGGTDPTNPAPSGDPTLGVSLTDPAGCTVGTGTLTMRFKWRDWATSTTNHLYVASYYYVAGTDQLERVLCVDGGAPAVQTLGNNITSVSPSCNPAACPPIPDSVLLTISAPNIPNNPSSSLYTYTLSATVRPQGQAAPSGAATAGFPSLLALGGCSTGTASGSAGLSSTGNLTAGVYGPVVVNTADAGSCHAFQDSSAHLAFSAPSASLLNSGTCTGNQCPAQINHVMSALPDPFLTMPAPADCTTQTGSQSGNTFTAGVFKNAVTINGSSVLGSGNYTFCNGVTFSGTVNATPAAGLLFYVAQGPVTIGGSLTITPQSSGPYSGLSLWFGTSANITAFDFSNVSLFSPAGIFYAPITDVTIDGPSHILIGSIIAQSVSLASNNLLGHIGLAATLGAPSPAVGSAGSSATISGTQFLPSTLLTIKVGGQTATVTSGGTSDASGNVNATFTIPAGLAAGPYSVTVSDGLDTVTSGTQFTVTPPPHLVFTSTAVTGVASATATLGPITVQEQDAGNNPVIAPAGGTVVNLSSNSTGTAVFSTTSGGAAVTQVTIPAGSSSVSFYYGDTKAGTPTITAASAGVTSGTQAETITAGTAAGIVLSNITTSPTPALTQAGVIGSTLTYTSAGEAKNSGNVLTARISLADAFGNLVNAATAQTIDLSATGSGTVAPSGTSVLTISAGTSTTTAAFTLTRTTSNNVTVTLTATLHGTAQKLTVKLSS